MEKRNCSNCKLIINILSNEIRLPMISKNICKFCGQEKKLIKAHIIPRNFYLNYKNEKYLGVDSISGKFTIQQSGAYDKNILCEDCDGKILGEFDKEGYRILFSEVYKHILYSDKNTKIYYLTSENYNYEYLRKFFISILWRASISNVRELDDVHLGKYENIALKILKGEEKYKDLFKTYIFKYPNNEDFNRFVFIAKSKIGNHNAYVINMAGYSINIIINGNNHPYDNIYQMRDMLIDDKYFCIVESNELYERHYYNASLKMQEMWQKGFKPPFASKL